MTINTYITTRNGWTPLEPMGAPEQGTEQHAYQADGERGIMGSDADGWYICAASDGYVADSARRYDTADDAARAADEDD